MKRTGSPYIVILIIILITSFLGECKKPERVIKIMTLDVEQEDINYDEVIIRGEIIDLGDAPVQDHGIAIKEIGASGDFMELSRGKPGSEGIFQAVFADPQPSTEYDYKAYANDGSATVYGNTKRFSSLSPKPPVIIIYPVQNITLTSAVLTAEVTDERGSTVVERGFCYSTLPDPDPDDEVVINEQGGSGKFSEQIVNLITGSTYYVRAFATNSQGTSYSNQIDFVAAEMPIVETLQPENISPATATFIGNVLSEGGVEVIERGFCYNTSPDPDLDDGLVQNEQGGLGEFMNEVSNLSPATEYFVKAYATNSVGTAYGVEKSFITPDPSIFVYSMIGTAFPGGDWDTDYDFIYQSNSNYVYTYEIPNLELLQNGYFKIRRDHDWEIQYGANNLIIPGNSFTTMIYDSQGDILVEKGTTFRIELDIDWASDTRTLHFDRLSPEVYTGIAYSIGSDVAKCEGEVSDQGESPVNERGICYSIDNLPTIDDNKITAGSGLGPFVATLENLISNTSYYYRAYALNDQGISYGKELSFTTQ